jgi:hypothetical protein
VPGSSTGSPNRYGSSANGNRGADHARARELLAVPALPQEPDRSEAEPEQPRVLARPCPCCGGRLIIIETFARGGQPNHRPTPDTAPMRRDSS